MHERFPLGVVVDHAARHSEPLGPALCFSTNKAAMAHLRFDRKAYINALSALFESSPFPASHCLPPTAIQSWPQTTSTHTLNHSYPDPCIPMPLSPVHGTPCRCTRLTIPLRSPLAHFRLCPRDRCAPRTVSHRTITDIRRTCRSKRTTRPRPSSLRLTSITKLLLHFLLHPTSNLLFCTIAMLSLTGLMRRALVDIPSLNTRTFKAVWSPPQTIRRIIPISTFTETPHRATYLSSFANALSRIPSSALSSRLRPSSSAPHTHG